MLDYQFSAFYFLSIKTSKLLFKSLKSVSEATGASSLYFFNVPSSSKYPEK